VIGGYIFRGSDEVLLDRLNTVLTPSYNRIPLANNGFLFHDEPFSDHPTAAVHSDRLTVLSQDLLVIGDAGGDYSLIDAPKDLPGMLWRDVKRTFGEIVSDYRMIVVERSEDDTHVYLVSHRAGNGRMYYHRTATGILFCSDIRFLLRIIPLELNDIGVYGIMKYGAIPEPMTISANISAVPAAHFLRCRLRDGSCRTEPYFQYEFPCDSDRRPAGDFDALLRPARRSLQGSARFLRQHRPAILISGGIDSSLYASYLHESGEDRLHGINCTFGDDDPEFPFARAMAERIDAVFHVGRMRGEDALPVLNDAVALTGHPFSDFSSLPIVFILKFMKEHVPEADMLIEGNGGDDCFGFPALGSRSKMLFKNFFPRAAKDALAGLLRNSRSWRWESHQGLRSRLFALADVHETILENYFLVLTPVNYLRLNAPGQWDRRLTDLMEEVFSSYAKGNGHSSLSYEARVTIRQLMHVNSRRWAAKAFSVSESLGIRCIYPYIWRDILIVQGTLPWKAKIKNGIVKWPLKRLLEEFMPHEFIYRPKSGFVPPFVRWLTCKDFNDTVREILSSSTTAIGNVVPPGTIAELLDDALQGRKQRHALLNFLWGALFTEMWVQRYKNRTKLSF
jgi:asparagine synthase (glutamine-hydrolysing)